MNDKELDLLLGEALGEQPETPAYLNTRLRGELSVGRKAGRGISLWWLPLALSLGMGIPVFLLGALMPWPLSAVLKGFGVLGVASAALFTGVGLVCFDLREKGRVLL